MNWLRAQAIESRHSGQAKREPESRILKAFWIPAFAGMTEQTTFARASSESIHFPPALPSPKV
jgi:hypothetical protein